jgi:CRISPR/Cas system-associated endoribonuclease Cas2
MVKKGETDLDTCQRIQISMINLITTTRTIIQIKYNLEAIIKEDNTGIFQLMIRKSMLQKKVTRQKHKTHQSESKNKIIILTTINKSFNIEIKSRTLQISNLKNIFQINHII